MARLYINCANFHFIRNGRLITESSATGTILREYIYFNDEPLALVESGSEYYFANDHLGSSQALFNQSGQTVWQAQYDPFGAATVSPDSTLVNNLRLPGQYFDSETGLHYNWHRYYEPALGRYLRPDPIGLDGGLNLYAYVGNDPANAVDPFGLDSHHIIPQAIWRNMNLSPEVVAILDSAVVEAGEHYYTTNHRSYNSLIKILWDDFFLGAKSEEITSCAARRFVKNVKSQPEAKALLRRLLSEGGAKVVPKWLRASGRVGSRLVPVIGWALVVGDAVFGDPVYAY